MKRKEAVGSLSPFYLKHELQVLSLIGGHLTSFSKMDLNVEAPWSGLSIAIKWIVKRSGALLRYLVPSYSTYSMI